MGFDVTFHPVSPRDLQYFVFDVFADPSLAPSRAAELTDDPAKQAFVSEGIYGRFASWTTERPLRFAGTIAFACAAVAGFRHPYWYAGGLALSFLGDTLGVAPRFTPLPRLARGPVHQLTDESEGLIRHNYSASGLLEPAQLVAVVSQLQSLEDRPADAVGFALADCEGRQALERAVGYARRHELGLIEAADLVVPFAGQSSTDIDHLRGRFVGRLEP